jgi:hypothetical protein
VLGTLYIKETAAPPNTFGIAVPAGSDTPGFYFTSNYDGNGGTGVCTVTIYAPATTSTTYGQAVASNQVYADIAANNYTFVTQFWTP